MKCLFGLHKWSKWERYVWQGKTWVQKISAKGIEQSEPKDVTEDRQKRRCEICGFNQDRRIS